MKTFPHSANSGQNVHMEPLSKTTTVPIKLQIINSFIIFIESHLEPEQTSPNAWFCPTSGLLN